MQLTPPGIPFPQERGGGGEGSSPLAYADAASVVAQSPTARMNAVRCMSGDSNVLSSGAGQANRTSYLRVQGARPARHPAEEERSTTLLLRCRMTLKWFAESGSAETLASNLPTTASGARWFGPCRCHQRNRSPQHTGAHRPWRARTAPAYRSGTFPPPVPFSRRSRHRRARSCPHR